MDTEDKGVSSSETVDTSVVLVVNEDDVVVIVVIVMFLFTGDVVRVKKTDDETLEAGNKYRLKELKT